MAKRARDYRAEYDQYHSQPEKIAERASRNAARAAVEKKAGKLPANKEVDHVNGNPKDNRAKNLRVMDKGANRRKGG